jgi:predicted DNA-binding protein
LYFIKSGTCASFNHIYILCVRLHQLEIDMPNQTNSKRVQVSLPPELHAVFDDLSELQNKPKSRLVVEILQAALPSLILMRDSLQAVKDGMNPDEVAQNLLQTAKEMVEQANRGCK